ncbi:MAG: hypothetical protein K2X47_03430 [Bdellovibrionales bacterium]|nr:hypothetical protein [Bdellovibrionales bacterium]
MKNRPSRSCSRMWIGLLLTLSFAVSTPGWSQTSETDANANPSNSTRRQVATIIMAGLGGAILGLSTLSFYGRPQDNLSNIAMGFGVGIIGGVIFVTYKAATNPREFYGTRKEAAVLWEDPVGPVALAPSRLGIQLTF